MPPKVVVTCPKCGKVIGTELEYEGVRLLNTGTALAAEFHGICGNCSEVIHWSVKMQRVLACFRMMTGREVTQDELEKRFSPTVGEPGGKA